MKKIILTLLGIFIIIPVMVSQTLYDDSKWSIEARAGLTYYRVAIDKKPNVSAMNKLINDVGKAIPDFRVRYSLNSIFDFGLAVGMYDFNRHRVSGGTTDFTLMSSANLSEWANPYRNRNNKRWNWYGNIGVGIASHNFAIYQQNRRGSGASPVISVGLNLELNLSRSWSLSGEGQYRLYLTKNMSGIESSWFNDALIGTFGIRYKFKSKSKCYCDF